MKTKKLNLEELNVDSFVTTVNKMEGKTVQGGQLFLETMMLAAHTLEAVESIIKITNTINDSNINGDCTGWSRLNCNGTGQTSPCDSMC